MVLKYRNLEPKILQASFRENMNLDLVGAEVKVAESKQGKDMWKPQVSPSVCI